MKKPALVRYRFESVEELVSSIPSWPVHSDNRLVEVCEGSGWLCSDRPQLNNWTVCQQEMAKLSFPRGVERLNTLSSQISVPSLTGVRRRLCRSFEGDDLNVERIWQGDLNTAWTKAKRLETQGPKRILVCLEISAPAIVKAESLSWRGAAAVSLAKALADAGHVVQLEARCLNELIDSSKTMCEMSLVAKGATEAFDEHKLASIFCSAMFFRGVVLKHFTYSAEQRLDLGISFSRDVDLKGTSEAFDCLVGLSREQVKDKESAQSWINKQMEKLAL